MSIVMVGMLDEREEALQTIKEQIEKRGHKTILIDVSVGVGAILPSLKADISCRELARLATEAGEDTGGAFVDANETAASTMTAGLAAKVSALHKSGELDGIIAITGMTGALISLPAMKALPFGVPKLLITTAAAMPAHAEQLADYFGLSDITVMHAVVDTVGMNSMVRKLALNGANAIVGMVEGAETLPQDKKPSIAMTEFGFCDRGAYFVRDLLERDFEIVSFHANGLGDRALLDLVRRGLFEAVIDLVPCTFSEYLLGGNRPSGPDRLGAARDLPIPYIFCPGGIDMISCGPIDRKDIGDPLWVSRKLAARKLHIQDRLRVQARTNPEEMKEVATAVAERLNQYKYKSKVKIVIPRQGFSSLSTAIGVLSDPASDQTFITTLRTHLDPQIGVFEVECDVNSREFARIVVDALLEARGICDQTRPAGESICNERSGP